MGHPVMFSEQDPNLARIRQIALGYPSSAEKVSHGRPAFYTTKVFAYYGGSLKVDGVWVEHAHSLLVLPDRDEREALLADPRVYLPGYLGVSGWIGFDLDGTGWDQAGELIDASYRNTAPARLVGHIDSL